MKKVKKQKAPKVKQELREFEKEMILVSHLLKYNMYLLSKSIVFGSILQALKTESMDVNTAVNAAANYTHAILMAFHDQDHRKDQKPEQPSSKTPELDELVDQAQKLKMGY